ncbi:MAG TPA: SDR family oxidoreductase [Oligoflexia bacterium]|nr:SDR family oxidoreductase [Oligoflexia bacterium]
MREINYQFDGKVALVTGAASGIGRATAIAFAKSGANVVVADVLEKGGTETASMIDALGRKALFVRCDVSDTQNVKDLVRRTVEKFGRLDFAFNNAGIEDTPASTTECTEDNWHKTIDINLKGVWLCMKYEIPELLKQGGGAIVNCSSIAGLIGFSGIPAYTASKHGVIGLTKTAALEYSKSSIRVNAVCPGVIQTPMIDRFTQGSAEAKAQLTAGAPMGRVGLPEEIANAVLWLCSDSASYMTGQTMTIDGGWVAQ